jgi:hypothetical protein
MDEKAQYCYSCYDQMMFQMYGQTSVYDPGQQSKQYLKQYEEMGKPDITCDLCDRTVFYFQQEGGKYLEAERQDKGEAAL